VIIFLSFIYFLSMIGCWIGTRCYLIKYHYQRAGVSDVMMVILPGLNTFACLYYFSYIKININTIGFFKINDEIYKKVSK
jgi:hypothetical protein